MNKIQKLVNKPVLVALIIWCICLVVLYSVLSILRHNHFQSGAFDLGLYDQAIWKFGHFLGAYNTVKERIIFGDHLVLTLPLFGVLYYLWDNVRILLIVQAVIVVSSAIPIFLIAKKRLVSELSALCIAVIYSLFYGIQYGVYSDFHPIILGVALLSYLAYFWEYDKKILFWLTFAVGLATQENMGIAIAGLAAIFFFRKEFRKRAVLVGIIAVVYSVLSTKVVSLFSPVGYQYWPQFPSSIVDAVIRLFDSEEKRQVWLYSYSSFSFLPLFSPGSVIAVGMDLFQYFVTGPAFSRMWSPFMHHRAILAPLLTLGTIDVLFFLRKRKINITHISVALLCVSILLQYIFHFPLNKLAKSDYWEEEPWMKDTRELVAQVPKNASLATQQNIVPHLSHRNEIYLVVAREHEQEELCEQLICWWLDFGGTPEYLLVDTRHDQWLTQILQTSEHWNSAIENMEKRGKITIERQIGEVKLYRIVK